ncbi:hypothetical protein LINPERPRIM_LOCUS31081, partial [Linum perenne]
MIRWRSKPDLWSCGMILLAGFPPSQNDNFVPQILQRGNPVVRRGSHRIIAKPLDPNHSHCVISMPFEDLGQQQLQHY